MNSNMYMYIYVCVWIHTYIYIYVYLKYCVIWEILAPFTWDFSLFGLPVLSHSIGCGVLLQTRRIRARCRVRKGTGLPTIDWSSYSGIHAGVAVRGQVAAAWTRAANGPSLGRNLPSACSSDNRTSCTLHTTPGFWGPTPRRLRRHHPQAAPARQTRASPGYGHSRIWQAKTATCTTWRRLCLPQRSTLQLLPRGSWSRLSQTGDPCTPTICTPPCTNPRVPTCDPPTTISTGASLNQPHTWRGAAMWGTFLCSRHTRGHLVQGWVLGEAPPGLRERE